MSTTLHSSNGVNAEQEKSSVLKPFGHVCRGLRNILSALQQARLAKDGAAVEAEEAQTEAYEARVEFEAEQIRVDPDGRRRGSLFAAVVIAIGLTLLDVVPAWWAAEALGGGLWATAVVALLLVAALAGLAALLSHFKHDEAQRAFDIVLAGAVLLVLVESGLRLVYLLVTSSVGLMQAALEVGLLALVTGGLIGVSYVVLVWAEALAMYKLRLEVEGLEATAKAKQAAAIRARMLYRNQARALRHVDRTRLDHLSKLDRDVHDELVVAADEEGK
jgi:hypothetical protein